MKKEKNLSISTRIIIMFLLATIIIPIIINLLLYLPFPPTPSDLGNKEWLAFWGSFIGGSIGGIATLFAVYYTLKQNIEQNQTNLNVQRKQSRLDIIPYIDVRLFLDKPSMNPAYFIFRDLLIEEQDQPKEKSCSEDKVIQFPSGYIIFKSDKVYYSNKLDKEYKTILEQGGIAQRQEGNVISFYNSGVRSVSISMTNIGLSSAINVTLELNSNTFSNYAIMPSFNLKVQELVVLNLVFDRDFPDGEHLFNIKTDDLQGNEYIQRFKIKLKDKGNYLERISSPELIKAYEV